MKRFILLLLIAVTWSFQAEASHILGGDIQYKYVGDSTGVTGQYPREIGDLPPANRCRPRDSSNCQYNLIKL